VTPNAKVRRAIDTPFKVNWLAGSRLRCTTFGGYHVSIRKNFHRFLSRYNLSAHILFPFNRGFSSASSAFFLTDSFVSESCPCDNPTPVKNYSALRLNVYGSSGSSKTGILRLSGRERPASSATYIRSHSACPSPPVIVPLSGNCGTTRVQNSCACAAMCRAVCLRSAFVFLFSQSTNSFGPTLAGWCSCPIESRRSRHPYHVQLVSVGRQNHAVFVWNQKPCWEEPVLEPHFGRAKLPLSREAGTRIDSAARREPRPPGFETTSRQSERSTVKIRQQIGIT